MFYAVNYAYSNIAVLKALILIMLPKRNVTTIVQSVVHWL